MPTATATAPRARRRAARHRPRVPRAGRRASASSCATSTSTIARRRDHRPARRVGVGQVDAAAPGRRASTRPTPASSTSTAARSPRSTSACAVAFQEPRLLPWRTHRPQRRLGLPARHRARRTGRARVAELLEPRRPGASGRPLRPRQVSGGMAQRASLARALARGPGILLLDEPFGALDALTRLTMQDLLLDIHAAEPATILLVTHDVDEALALADRVILLGEDPQRPGEGATDPRDARRAAARPRDRADARPRPAARRSARTARRRQPPHAGLRHRAIRSPPRLARPHRRSTSPPIPTALTAPPIPHSKGTDTHEEALRRTRGDSPSPPLLALTGLRRGRGHPARRSPRSRAPTAGAPTTSNIDFATYNPLSLIIKDQGWLEEALGRRCHRHLDPVGRLQQGQRGAARRGDRRRLDRRLRRAAGALERLADPGHRHLQPAGLGGDRRAGRLADHRRRRPEGRAHRGDEGHRPVLLPAADPGGGGHRARRGRPSRTCSTPTARPRSSPVPSTPGRVSTRCCRRVSRRRGRRSSTTTSTSTATGS